MPISTFSMTNKDLLALIGRLVKEYEEELGELFINLSTSESVNILLDAVSKILSKTSSKEDIDISRPWNMMKIHDMKLFFSCLRTSVFNNYMLLRYDEIALWGNEKLDYIQDIWSIYQGLLLDCRSPIIDLSTMNYVSLPFKKFRNINETSEYSIDAIKLRISNAKTPIEFSEKLDGSFIQMSYIRDPNLYKGIIISSSSSLDINKSSQLNHSIRYLKRYGANIVDLVTSNLNKTFIFEWISADDPHIVSYTPDMYGLHLIGIRDILTGYLYPYSEVVSTATTHNIPTTLLYNKFDLDGALSSLQSLKGSEHEGYVLYIDQFLVKIKCPEFLSLFRDTLISSSYNSIIEYTFKGTIDDYISMLPEAYQESARDKLKEVTKFILDVEERVDYEYSKLPPNASRKEVMLYIDKIKDRGISIKGLVRNKYLGKPLEVLAKKRGDTYQYIKKSVIDDFYLSGGKLD